MGHIPFLWALALGASAALAWLIIWLLRHNKRLQTPARKWGIMVVLFIVFSFFIAPLVVALGSIMITGRTM